MNEPLNLTEILQDERWVSKGDMNYPTPLEDIAEIEEDLGCQFPEDYRQLLGYCEGGEFFTKGGRFFGLYDASEVFQFTIGPYEGCAEDLPGMIMIGADGGSARFYYDPVNYLTYGEWAIYLVASPRCFEYSTYVARSITHLLHRLLEGDDLYAGSFLKNEGILPRPD